VSARTIVVTGASAGVGRATVRAFGERGCNVALLARGADGLSGAAKDVEAAGGRPLAIEVDVVDPTSVDSAAEETERAFGPIDVWVNNAMTSVFGEFADLSVEEFRRVTEVTYLGTVHGTMTALHRMLPRNRGVVVQVGSALAYRAIPLQSAYCGAKHAVKGFTDSVRCELMHHKSGVRITMVHLPGLNTPQFDVCRTKMPRLARPVPPVFQPEVAADAIVWASEHPRREVHVGASTVTAILANKFAAGALDRYLARTNYEAQQRDEIADPVRPDDLFAPVPGDHGAHGPFDREARPRSVQWVLDKLRHRLGY
jgi:short-subunit dehydrogenase